MPIPSEILAVWRPPNTVVHAYGKNKDKYGVRQRIGCRYEDGKHKPINGPTIGHIIDGVYVPLGEEDKPKPLSESGTDLKDWADVVLADRIFSDILEDLKLFYEEKEALRIYIMAILRVCFKGVKDYELKEAYENSYLSELYPGVAISKNTVSDFLNHLGRVCGRITKFMKHRVASVDLNSPILVDGTLKSNESKINDFSEFSRKARTKGTKDISVMFAFDLERMEPICSKCFPGNMLDSRAYASFIEECGINKGIIVADKGFPSASAKKQFKERPGLGFLNPLKRNTSYIKTYSLTTYEGTLKKHVGIIYKKVKCENEGKWLYSYRDQFQASQEEADFLKNARDKGKYDDKVFKEKQESFGTIVLECNQDLDPEVVYTAYDERWNIEVLMRYYKSALEFDETRVHDNYSVIGTEFVDFLATLLTSRLVNEFDKANLLTKDTYSKVMKKLKKAKKVREEDKKDWHFIRMNEAIEDMLKALNLIPKEPKKSRGRPSKKK